MKGLTAIVAVAMVIGAGVTPAAAQEVHVGAVGGFGLTQLAFSPAPPIDLTKPLRPSAGGLISIDLTEMVGIETRVVWQRKAARWQQSDGDLTAKATAQLDYLSVPVLLRVAAPRGTARPYALAGAEVSFNTRAVVSGTVDGSSGGPAAVSDQDMSDQVRGTDVAVTVGGGLEFPTGRASMFLEGLYSHGLRNLPEENADTEFVNAKARTFRVGVGIRF